jgi:DNA adenine methylase
VLLAKPESGHETVNDLHGDLINLARVIQHEKQGPTLYRRLRRVLVDECYRDEVLALPPTDDPIERAYRYFIVSWFGRNGFCGTVGCEKSSFAVRWTPGGGHGGLRFANIVASIPAFRRRLRRVTILNRDAFEVLEKIDDTAGVAVYADPPYLVKGSKYTHDFEDGFMSVGNDHERLAGLLCRFKRTRVVVSYYDHPALRALYPKWTVRDCAMNRNTFNGAKRGGTGKEAPEVLLINGPSYALEVA